VETLKKSYQSIEAYIADLPASVAVLMQSIRETVRSAAPNATEAIKYGMPTFVQQGILMSFAAWKKHIAIYPVTAEMEAAIPELAAYETSGKGTIRFLLDQPLPIDLIRAIVAFRLNKAVTTKVQ
jgi:uncharacterized protein YdhG (YjbR/CyaY superfamily)